MTLDTHASFEKEMILDTHASFENEMIFDTHAHYDDEAFQEDLDTVMEKLKANRIGRIVDVGASLNSSKEAIKLTQKYDFVYAAVGVHPSETGELTENDLPRIEKLLQDSKCVAVGEIGLDFHYPEPSREVQITWFERQMELARRAGLPIIVHSRDAAQDTLRVMQANHAGEIGGVVHCYSYSKEAARDYLNMGMYFGIGGVITFKNARKLVEAVEYIPMDAIVLETDCPYLAPEPHRGSRNTSAYLHLVAEKIAAIKKIPVEEVIQKTWENGWKLYRM